MAEDLLSPYERELGYLREDLADFAERYPKVARRLQIYEGYCDDPQVGRLMETFAFTAARVHQRLESEFPEIAVPLVETSSPHFLRPVPAATVLQLMTDFQETGNTTRIRIPRHTEFQSQDNSEPRCRFRTCFNTELWPVQLKEATLALDQTTAPSASFQASAAAITLVLEGINAEVFSELAVEALRFYIDGETSSASILYHLLFSELQAVTIDNPANPSAPLLSLPVEAVHPVGFEGDEALLEWRSADHMAYRLLTEYFAFPEKFLFFELRGLTGPHPALQGKKIRVRLFFSSYGKTCQHDQLLKTFSAQNLKLNCVPVVNLFRHAAKDVTLTEENRFSVIPRDDPKNECEIYKIDSVKLRSRSDQASALVDVPPFYSLVSRPMEVQESCFWHHSPEGSGYSLSLVDASFKPFVPAFDSVEISLVCMNRNVSGTQTPVFSLPDIGGLSTLRTLKNATPCLYPPTRSSYLWSVVSLLSARLTQSPHQVADRLRFVLELCNFSNQQGVRGQIQGILSVNFQVVTARAPGMEAGFSRGIEVTVTFDESCYSNANFQLFSSLLKRLLEEHCEAGSFIRFCRSFKEPDLSIPENQAARRHLNGVEPPLMSGA